MTSKKPAEAPAAPASTISLTSLQQMRAMAHPLRLQILGELRVGGPRTAGGLSEVFDEAPGTLSYHLGKLAEGGFIEEATELAADRRERWWRAAHEFTRVSAPDAQAPAAEHEVTRALRHQVADLYAAALHKSIDSEDTLPREWVDAATTDDGIAFLTAAELAEASAELHALVKKWHALGRAPRDGDTETQPVQLIVHASRRA
ncbi:ArsR/SmtB family transcription factor [Leifsonia sp. A12D58]|uniref:ArsR/SmtB family transcription factor n=1 Tax=Leifsonia sp. A12D58 TaxID=3397674 RepID=UPI0039DF9C33